MLLKIVDERVESSDVLCSYGNESKLEFVKILINNINFMFEINLNVDNLGNLNKKINKKFK